MPYNSSYYWQGNQPNRRYQGSLYNPHHQGSSSNNGSYEDGSRNNNANGTNSSSHNTSGSSHGSSYTPSHGPSSSSLYGYRRDFQDRPSSSYYRGRGGYNKRKRSSQYDRYNPNNRYRPQERREEESDPRALDRRPRPKQLVRPAFELNSLQDAHGDDFRYERRDSKSSVSSKSSFDGRADDSVSRGLSPAREDFSDKSTLSKSVTRESDNESVNSHQTDGSRIYGEAEAMSETGSKSRTASKSPFQIDKPNEQRLPVLESVSTTETHPLHPENHQDTNTGSLQMPKQELSDSPQIPVPQGSTLRQNTQTQTNLEDKSYAASAEQTPPAGDLNILSAEDEQKELSKESVPTSQARQLQTSTNNSTAGCTEVTIKQLERLSTTEESSQIKEDKTLTEAQLNTISDPVNSAPTRTVGTSDSSVLTPVSAGSKEDPDVIKLKTLAESDDMKAEDLSDAETVISDSNPTTENANKLMKELATKEARPDESNESSEYSDGSESEGKTVVVAPKRRFKKRPYVIKRDASGSSLLQRACKKGNLAEVKELISRGADPNECDFCGFTCLHEASLAGHTDVVKYLIEMGADVNKQAFEAGDLETPLIDAADNKHLDIVKILLDNGADPRIFNSDGFNALTKIHSQHEDEDGYDEIIRLLEEASNKFSTADAYSKDKKPTERHKSVSPGIIVEDPNDTYFLELLKKKNHAASIYKYAAEGIKDLTVQYLVEGGRLDYKPDILILAARNGHVELVDIMLGLVGEYDINIENKRGLTALLASVGRGHLDVVKFLLSKGANPFMRRKPDNLNALEIAERSPNFSSEEVDVIESYMKKNVNYSVLTRAPSGAELTEQKTLTKPNAEKQSDYKRKSLSVEIQDERKAKKPRTKTSEPTPKTTVKDAEKVLVLKSISHLDNMEVEEDTEEASGIVPQASSVFSKEKTPETELRFKSSETTASPTRSKHSMSPSPQPLTKAQEEIKAKSAKDAKIYQEKVEAKKKARRHMFLKSEKEKERKRKEEELKKIEEQKREETRKREEEARKLKELEEETKRVEEEKQKLGIKLIMDSYPIGLRYAKLGVPVPKEDIQRFSPLYIFSIGGVSYVTDLQITLLTGEMVPTILQAVPADASKEATWEDKSKLWRLFFPLIGTYGPTKDLAELINSGYEKFKFLQISFVKLQDVESFVRSKFPETYLVVWEASRFIKVDLASLEEFHKVQDQASKQPKSEFDVEVVTSFVPPKFKNRPDVLRAIYDAKMPMW